MIQAIFTLSNFKYFFKVEKLCKEIGEERAELLQQTYRQEQGRDVMCLTYKRDSDYYGTIEYRVTAQTLHKLQEIYAFLIEWTSPESGQKRSETIYLTTAESNLLYGTKVYYFLCSHTGRRCRKLYTDGEHIASFAAFGILYESQSVSSKQRAIAVYRDVKNTDPHRKYGRLTYNGRLTPYGKRVQRWQERVEASGKIWEESLGRLFNGIREKANRTPPEKKRRKS